MACTAEQHNHQAAVTAGPHALLSYVCCMVNPSNDAISCPRCVSSGVVQLLQNKCFQCSRQTWCFSAAALRPQPCTLCQPLQETHNLLSFLLLGGAVLHLSISAHSALLSSEGPCPSVKSMRPHHNQQQQRQPECIASHAYVCQAHTASFYLIHQKTSHHTKIKAEQRSTTAQLPSNPVQCPLLALPTVAAAMPQVQLCTAMHRAHMQMLDGPLCRPTKWHALQICL